MASELTELYPGERVLWSGAPTRYPLLSKADAYFLPMSILWTVLGLFFMVVPMLRGDRPRGFFPLPLVLLFGLIVAYLLVGRYVLRRRELRSTTYTVTDRRVIVSSRSLFGLRVRSAYLGSLPPPLLVAESGTVGTIKFGELTFLQEIAREHQRMGGRRTEFVPELIQIEHARQVRDTIALAQHGPSPR